MPIEFTPEQQKVIDIRGCNVLVSAAAGSGKTAVLVQRIINMILDETHPIDIDQLLVVTFTEAAALEMRSRISDAITAKLEEDPTNAHLQKQSALLYKAQISTIHSFCLNLIRNNFNVIGLDPGFRVADEAELNLLSKEVLDNMFEEKYEADDSYFEECVRYFSKGVSDEALKEAILNIVRLSEGNPWPEEWLDDCVQNYEIDSVSDLEEAAWVVELVDYAKNLAKEAYEMTQRALQICEQADGPDQYIDNIKSDADIFEGLLGCEDYDAIKSYVEGIQFSKLSTKKGQGSSDDLKNLVKELRENYKKIVKGDNSSSINSLFESSLDDELELMKKVCPYVKKLIELCKEYLVLFNERKLDEGVISFSDMEHFALNILYTTDENACHELSTTALEYQSLYEEILMDEYQDCNRVQELLIHAISKENRGEKNRFVVGDVKQSIYKFRLSSPELFIEKYNRFKIVDLMSQEECTDARIDLHQNFRSRKSVIDTVNDLFGQIMHEDLGGVEYDDDAKLVYGSKYIDFDDKKEGVSTDFSSSGTNTEIMLMTKDNLSNFKKENAEAMMVAAKIKSMVGKYPVTDKKTGALRPCSYKDIVILVRSATDVAMGLKYVFGMEGIPSYLPVKSGFYDTKEIQQIVQLLKLFDNPMQDIPLYGGLKSFFGGFTDEEIAAIKKDGLSLYKSLLEVKEDNQKVASFLSFVDEYRFKCTYMPINEVLSELIYDLGYIEYVSAMAGGTQKRANVEMLINKAIAYEKTSFKGLFHFVNYLKEIIKSDAEEGEADVLDENADVVRIMTIHKSKGLEFPICFLCGIHKQFNLQDTKGNIITQMTCGLGVSYIDLARRTKQIPLYKKVVAHKITQETIGEELRVLYVALTRAKEKLIITGMVDEKDGKASFENQMLKYEVAHEDTDRMSYYELSTSRSYYDFIMPIMKNASLMTMDDLISAQVTEASEKIERKGRFAMLLEECDDKNPNLQALNERIGKKYQHEELKDMVLKTSVSELKKAYLDFENTVDMYTIEKDSKDSKDSSMSATERGSAYHKVMELLDFNNQDIKSQLNNFINNGYISKEWADAVPIHKIETFMQSALAKRMAEAQQNKALKREQPFVLGIDANRVKETYPEGETILLQGIIDAFFTENNEIILVDYKTDVIESGQALMNRYHVQLEYYKEALERILQMNVKECILYSFCLGETVVM